MTILRPFLVLASVAFATGFTGYLAVAKVHDFAAPAAVQPAISAVAPAEPADAWDMGQQT